VPKSGGRGDNPAAKHYQIAFEFERRGVTVRVGELVSWSVGCGGNAAQQALESRLALGREEGPRPV